MNQLEFLTLFKDLKYSKGEMSLLCSLNNFDGIDKNQKIISFQNLLKNLYDLYYEDFKVFPFLVSNFEFNFHVSRVNNIFIKFTNNPHGLMNIKKLYSFLKKQNEKVNKIEVILDVKENEIKIEKILVEDYASTQSSHNVRKTHNTTMYLTNESPIPKIILLYDNKIEFEINNIKSYDNLIIIENKESFFRYKEFINLENFETIPNLNNSIILYSAGSINKDLHQFILKFNKVNCFFDYDKAGFDMFNNINHPNKQNYYPKTHVLTNIINLIMESHNLIEKEIVYTDFDNIDYKNLYNISINNSLNDKFIFIEQEILLHKKILKREILASKNFSHIIIKKDFKFIIKPLIFENLFEYSIPLSFLDNQKIKIIKDYKDYNLISTNMNELINFLGSFKN